MPAIWNSYSKSETARRPRMMTSAPTVAAKSHQQVVERLDLDLAAVARVGRISASTSCSTMRDPLLEGEQRLLADIDRDAITRRSTTLVARRMMSRWPLCDRVEGAGIDPDAQLAHGRLRPLAVAVPRAVRLGAVRPIAV